MMFAEIRKYLSNPYYGSQINSKISLAREVLAEMPDQVVWWMRKKLVKTTGKTF